MKIKAKRVVQPNQEIKVYIDRVLSCPHDRFYEVLKDFSWTFEKGDLYHWVPLLDCFDEYLGKIATRDDVSLEWSVGNQTPFPSQNVLSVLRTSAVILENCQNKHLYCTTEHLASLLASPDQTVVSASLAVLMALVRRSTLQSARFIGETFLNERLVEIARGFDGRDLRRDLVTCTSEDAACQSHFTPESLDATHFHFYKTSKESGVAEGCSNTITIPDNISPTQCEHSLLKQIVDEHGVPVAVRFKLLCQIRVQKHISSLDGRRQLVCNRLVAFIVLMQVHPPPDMLAKIFSESPELVNELISVVDSGRNIPEAVHMLALRALAVQVSDRHRHNVVITALSTGAGSGLLGLLIQRYVNNVVSYGSNTIPNNAIALLEALFSLIAAMVGSATGCNALTSAGLIPVILPLLEFHNSQALQLVTTSCRILESYLDNVPSAFNLFRDVGGITALANRLVYEVKNSDVSKLPVVDGNSKDIAPTVPYVKRNLIKFLFRAIAVTNYSPLTQSPIQNNNDQKLYESLGHIFNHGCQFGGHLFQLAASVMTDIIHQDPLIYPSLNDAGLPNAFISSIKNYIIPSGDAVCCVPTSLAAFCLSNKGLETVMQTSALDCLLSVFTTSSYIKCLNNDTVATLGANIEELMRHVPDLKEPTVELFLKILAILLDQSDHKSPVKIESADFNQLTTLNGAQDEQLFLEKFKTPEPDASVGDRVSRVAKVLESLLTNTEISQVFVEKNGISLLLNFFDVPYSPFVLGAQTPQSSITTCVRNLTQSFSKNIARPLSQALETRLSHLQAAALHLKGSVPDLPENVCKCYIKQLHMADCLLTLGANIARISTEFLSEISSDNSNSVINVVNQVERLVAKQTTAAQEWRMLRDTIRAMQQDHSSDAKLEINASNITSFVDAISETLSRPSPRVSDSNLNVETSRPTLLDRLSSALDPHSDSVHDHESKQRDKEKSLQEQSYDSLIAYSSTSRVFYGQMAKMIHNPPRRREESSSQCCQVAAAMMGFSLCQSLASVPDLWPGILEQLPEKALTCPVETTQVINYIAHMAGGLGSTLFDSRRHTCHTLILNYFNACGGVSLLLKHFKLALELYGTTSKIPDLPKYPILPDKIHLQQKMLKTAVDGCIRMYLQLLDYIVAAEQITASPQATTFLTLPLPFKCSNRQRFTSAEKLLEDIQQRVLQTVAPMWTNKDFELKSAENIQIMTSILARCLTGVSEIFASASRTNAPQSFEADPELVSQITDMGFTSVRVEEAIREVQQNNAEQILEWLVAHPSNESVDSAQMESSDDHDSEYFFPVHNIDTISTTFQPEEYFSPSIVVDGSVSILKKHPEMVFYVVEMITAVMNMNSFDLKIDVLKCLIGRINSLENIQDFEIESELRAVIHILAVLCTEHSTAIKHSHDLGMVDEVLRLAEKWRKLVTSVELSTSKDIDNLDENIRLPTWLDPALLIIDQVARIHPRNKELLASLDEQTSKYVKTNMQSIGEVDNTVSNEKSLTSDESNSASSEHDNTIAQIQLAVNKLSSTGGLLHEQQQKDSFKLCHFLLVYSKKWIDKLHVDADTASSHTRAVLQLLARLTKCYDRAQEAMTSGLHQLILELPAKAVRAEHGLHICAIIRHMLEDPVTLRLAMEAEITSTLSASSSRMPVLLTSAHQGSMLLRTFINAMGPVISRHPAIFLEALLNTCVMKKDNEKVIIKLKEDSKEVDGKAEITDNDAANSSQAHAHANSMRSVSKNKTTDPKTPKTKIEAPESCLKSTSKLSRKTASPAFSEIINLLLDKLMSYKGIIYSNKDDKREKSEENGIGEVENTIGSSNISDARNLNSTPAGSTSIENSGVVKQANTKKSRRSDEFTKDEYDIFKQCLLLKMLTDFTLMYAPTVCVILRRCFDTKAVGLHAKTPRKEVKSCSVFLRHLLTVHISFDPSPGWALSCVTRQAIALLLGISIRSIEGRRLIIAALVDLLNGNTGKDAEKSIVQPAMYKTISWVEVINSLACIYPGWRSRQSQSFEDMIQAMVDGGVRSSLINVLQNMESTHPKVGALVNTVLTPLECMLRQFLWTKKSSDKEFDASNPPRTPANGQLNSSSVQNDTTMDTRADHDSAVVPDALYAVMDAYGQHQRHHQVHVSTGDAREFDEMMAMMNEAYEAEVDSEDAHDYDSEESEDDGLDVDDGDEDEAEAMIEDSEPSADEVDPNDMSDYESENSENSEDEDEYDEEDETGIVAAEAADVRAFINARQQVNGHEIIDDDEDEDEDDIMDDELADHGLDVTFHVGNNRHTVHVDEQGMRDVAELEDGLDEFIDADAWDEEDEDDFEDGADIYQNLPSADLNFDMNIEVEVPRQARNASASIINGHNASSGEMLQELFGALGRRPGITIDTRRYRALNSNRFGTDGMHNRVRRSNLHALLQRPSPATHSNSSLMRNLHPMTVDLLQTLQDQTDGNSQRSEMERFNNHSRRPGISIHQIFNLFDMSFDDDDVLSSAIEYIVGHRMNGQPRQEIRQACWSDDGFPPVAANMNGIISGSIERNLAAVLVNNNTGPDTERETGSGAGEDVANNTASVSPNAINEIATSESRGDVVMPLANNPNESGMLSTPPSIANNADNEASDVEMVDANNLSDGHLSMENNSNGGASQDVSSMDPEFLNHISSNLREELQINLSNQTPINEAVASTSNADTSQLNESAIASSSAPIVTGENRTDEDPARPSNAQNSLIEDDLYEGIDPEFIAALPPDLQIEVIEQQRRERMLRSHHNQATGTQNTGPTDMDINTILALVPPDAREDALMSVESSQFSELTPALLAEVQGIQSQFLHRSSQEGFARSATTTVPRPSAINTMEVRTLPIISSNTNPSGTVETSLPRFTYTQSKIDLSDDGPQGPAPLTEEEIKVLVNLLRLNRPLSKQSVQKTFTNLCGHKQTRHILLKLLLTHLNNKVLGDKDVLDAPTLKRFLELLVHLVKAKPLLCEELPLLQTTSEVENKKAKLVNANSNDLQSGFLIVFSLLDSNICGRSNAHLILVLSILESVVRTIWRAVNKSNVIGVDLTDVTNSEEPETNIPVAGPSNMTSAPVAAEASSGNVVLSQFNKAKDVIAGLPSQSIGQLINLLGQERLSDQACSKIINFLVSLIELVPGHVSATMSALRYEIDRCAETATKELEALERGSADVRAGQVGIPLLRILKCIVKLTRVDQAPDGNSEWVDSLTWCSQRLDHMWSVLSNCLSKLEQCIQPQEQSHHIPPDAAQVLPFVEAFFALCEIRSGPNSSSEEYMVSSPEMQRQDSLASPLPASAIKAKKALAESQLPFLKFAEKHRHLLNALIRQHPKLLEETLEPLLKTPRLLDFDNKCTYFRSKVRSSHSDRHYGTCRISVRRGYVFEDSFHQLRVRTASEMKAKLSVQFSGEEGVDAGGVTREWYQVMAKEMFNPNFSLFVQVPEGGPTFQPNPNSSVQNDEARGTYHLDYFKFVGRIVGKALYDGQYVDAFFTRSLYKHMLSQPLTYKDIEAVDPEYFKNLVWMLENDITDVLDLTFTEEEDYFGKRSIKELKVGGKDIKVTESNKREYVNLKAQHHMTTAIDAQLKAFLGGFWDLIPQNLVKIFNDHELELLISGLPEIDIEDLKSNTVYHNFSAGSPTIQWFWDIVKNMEKQDLALLLQFVTGTSKVPLGGFKALQGTSGPQKFSIHKNFGDQSRLPTAHTCFNQLDLIEYDNYETLRDRLMIAIREGSEGFGFV